MGVRHSARRKNTPIRISIDSSPGELLPPRDHSAAQLMSLSAMPPRPSEGTYLPTFSIPGGCSVEITENYRRYALKPYDSRLHDFPSICATDYMSGLQILAHNDIFVRNFFMNKAKLSIDGNGYGIISFDKPVPAFEELLSNPMWLPIRDGKPIAHYSGRRKLCTLGHNRWESSTSENTGSKIIFEVVRDPWENVRLFESGYIDQTADTGTPVHLKPPHRGQRLSSKTSLRLGLFFCGDLASNAKRNFRNEISLALMSSDIANSVGWASVRSPAEDPEPLNFRTSLEESGNMPTDGIKLVYDDYYPNATVAWAIARQLGSAGIDCVPVSDTYRYPKAHADIRMTIFSGPTMSAWGRYAALMACPAWRNAPVKAREYIDSLMAPKFDDAVRCRLEELLDDLCPVVLLAAIPSVCFSDLIISDDPPPVMLTV